MCQTMVQQTMVMVQHKILYHFGICLLPREGGRLCFSWHVPGAEAVYDGHGAVYHSVFLYHLCICFASALS